MKIAAVLMQYDYGVQERGYSYEYYNILLPLIDVFGKNNIVHFDFYTEFKNSGKENMNKKLIDFLKIEKPDAAIFCLFENEFDEIILDEIKKQTKTIVYFFDDPWRQKFVSHWIKHFDFFSTPDHYMYRKYKHEGIENVIYSPFGFNKNIYKKLDVPKTYDVSFVGGYSPLRQWIVNKLKSDGIKVNIFGRGWGSNGKYISHDKMVEVFNRSKINLNLSNAHFNDIKFLAWAAKRPKDIKQLLVLKKNKEQVKGRHYEINACGGFQLSYFIPGLNLAFEIDREIAVYEDPYNIKTSIEYFLNDDELRESIAANGYMRAHKDHSAQNYLKNLFSKIMLQEK